MIISGIQTGNTRWLAAHLQNAADNETVDVVEVSGAVATDIDGALAEFDAIAAGTRASESVYAAFINPPVPLTRSQFLRAITHLEKALGLSGQPRIVLFHVKKGREHCHIVWSRIDAKLMRAIHLSHDRQKLRRCAQELAAEFGFELPAGLAQDRGSERFNDPPRPTKAEKAQEASSGLSRDERRAIITDCYRKSDSPEAFVHALEAAGFMLARGDKRALVVVDIAGEIHSLARQIDSVRTSDLKKKLEGLNLSLLPPAERAKLLMQQRSVAQLDAVRTSRTKDIKAKSEHERLTKVQGKRRLEIDRRWQAMKVRHMHEWKVLLAHIKAQEDRRIARRHWLAAGLAAYMQKIIFLRDLANYYEKRRKKTQEAQNTQLMASVKRRQENEAAEMQRHYDALARLMRREQFVFEQKFGSFGGRGILSGAIIHSATYVGSVKLTGPLVRLEAVDVTRQILAKNEFRINAGDITRPGEIKVAFSTRNIFYENLAPLGAQPSVSLAAWGFTHNASGLTIAATGPAEGLARFTISLKDEPKPD